MYTALIIYIAISVISGISGTIFDKALDSKLKRLGYVYTDPELYGAEAKLERFMNFIKNLACYIIPLFNLAPIVMLFSFEKMSDDVVQSGIKNNEIKKVDIEELEGVEPGYLKRRIEEVKRFQMEMGKKNIPRSYSEMSYDEKIDILLHELQIAFEEKAEAEGIDLDSVQPIIEDMPPAIQTKKLKKNP